MSEPMRVGPPPADIPLDVAGREASQFTAEQRAEIAAIARQEVEQTFQYMTDFMRKDNQSRAN